MLANYAELSEALLRADTAAMLVTYITRGDTAAMLATYINKADTAAMLSNYAELSEALLRTDTAAMLVTYITRGDTAAMLATYINKADTAAMLSNYAELSEALLRTDTAAMLANYAELSEALLRADTAAMLTTYITRGDTATMLTTYITRGDTALMLANYAELSEVAGRSHSATHELAGSDQVSHDNLLDFAANEHIDWTNATDEFTTTNDVNADTVKADYGAFDEGALFGLATSTNARFDSLHITGTDSILYVTVGVTQYAINLHGTGGGGGGATAFTELSDVTANYTGKAYWQARVSAGEDSLKLVPIDSIPMYVFNVKFYGATGNGTTDDITAINTALTAADGKALYFPAGTYVISAPITAAVDNVRIYGDGPRASIIYLEDGANDIMMTTGGDGWIIEDIGFDGNDANNTGTCHGISIAADSATIIRNCELWDIEDIAISVAGNCREIKIVDNKLISAAFGIDANDGDDIMIHRNRFITCTTPIDIDDADVTRAVVMDNNWYGCTNDMASGAATTPRITDNIDKAGAWFATDDK